MSRMTAAHSMTKMWEMEVTCLPGPQALPQAALFGDGHVHGGMPLHRPGQSLLALLPRRIEQPLSQEESEQHGQEDDHDRSADELGQP